MMVKLMDFKTPKGTKDYAFEEAYKKEKIILLIEENLKKWGYEKLYTPAMEMIQTLEAKTGEEIRGQIFKIENSEYALRFDLTVGSARFVANNNLILPYKRYCSGNVWRREEPQKGRLREFTQVDADIYGLESEEAEAELLAISSEILKKIGFSNFKIYLNNREILSDLVERYNKKKDENKILRILDKIEKIDREQIIKQLQEIGLSATQIEEIFNLDYKKASQISPKGMKRLNNIVEILSQVYGMSSEEIKIDFCLTRGLEYYTSTVFEIKLSDQIGSIAGGGRYDNLTALYGKKIAAVGISFGIERIMYLLKDLEFFRGIYISYLDKSYYKNAVELSKKLREEGFVVSTNLNQKKDLKEQLNYAIKNNFQYIIIIGKEEIEKNTYTLKDLRKRKQYYNLGYSQLVELLRNEQND